VTATSRPGRPVSRHDLYADGLRVAVPPVRAAHLYLARLDAPDILPACSDPDS
jgi:hypothetical protein